MKRLSYLVIMLCLATAGCGDDASSAGDGGSDSGTQAMNDAGDTKDSGTAKDSGTDTKPGKDAAVAEDAGNDEDANVTMEPKEAFGGKGIAIAYTADALGLDFRPKIVATLAEDGTLEKYQARLFDGTLSTMEKPTRGTCEGTDLYLDSIVAVGRLHDGTFGGKFYSTIPTFTADGGFHYAVGVQDASIPATGSVAYTSVVASTKPGSGTAAPGTVTGSAKVDFANKKVALDLTINYDGDAPTIKTTGGLVDPSMSEVSLDDTTGAVNGTILNGAAHDFVGGAIFGGDEDRLAITFSLSPDGNGGNGIHGVIVFEK